MNIPEDRIKKILTELHYISNENVTVGEAYAKSTNMTFTEAILDKGIITKDILGEAIAESYKTTYVDIKLKRPTSELVLKLKENFARKNMAVAIAEDEKTLTVATSDIENLNSVNEALKVTIPDKEIKLVYSFQEDIESVFELYKESLGDRISKILKKHSGIAPEIFQEIITDAVGLNASDVHFEPQEEDNVIIRFRIDGILQRAGNVNKEIFENILNRTKILANLPTDEHYTAQDGAIRMQLGADFVDLRISIVPIVTGQNLVVRMLSEYTRKLSLTDLGISLSDQEVLKSVYKKPFGMIISAGPTGSGKTTTMYSVLKLLDTPNVNITTIEDPVEYKLPGVNQIQVNPKTNITFAKGLRSIVRQDPNIILVGEIRDNETAEISINSALTGHLLLSTFHANDAATVIPRLLAMGIEPFLLASTLTLIIAQRLVRKICPSCRYSVELNKKNIEDLIPEGLRSYFPEGTGTIYQAKGCEACGGTGYKGRVGIFELVFVTPELQELTLTNPSSNQIREVASKQGAKTFFQDGLEKIMTGVTTIEELVRVAPLPINTKKLYKTEDK